MLCYLVGLLISKSAKHECDAVTDVGKDPDLLVRLATSSNNVQGLWIKVISDLRHILYTLVEQSILFQSFHSSSSWLPYHELG